MESLVSTYHLEVSLGGHLGLELGKVQEKLVKGLGRAYLVATFESHVEIIYLWGEMLGMGLRWLRLCREVWGLV